MGTDGASEALELVRDVRAAGAANFAASLEFIDQAGCRRNHFADQGTEFSRVIEQRPELLEIENVIGYAASSSWNCRRIS
jgi:hypothetical protein